MNRNIISSAIVLALYALVTIATSKAIPNTDEAKAYSYTSNCNTATTTSGQIEVLDTSIVSPSNLDYIDLGFPSANITLGNDVSGELAPSLIRLCTYSSNTNLGITTLTYTCSDNSIPACVITLITQ